MQWNKVKTILLVVLATVNFFFGANLFMQYIHKNMQQEALRRDVIAVLQEEGISGADTLKIPLRCSAIELSIERDTTMEEQVAKKLLSSPSREEDTDGTVRFSAQDGSVIWKSDGSIEANVTDTEQEDIPENSYLLRHRASAVLNNCGISMRAAKWSTDQEKHTATMTATVAGLPVFGRSLSVCFREGGKIRVYGQWSFGTPYARTVDRERTYEAGDALIRFARGSNGFHTIRQMEFGYRMLAGTSGTIQFAPTWRFETDGGEYLVNILKSKLEIN